MGSIPIASNIRFLKANLSDEEKATIGKPLFLTEKTESEDCPS